MGRPLLGAGLVASTLGACACGGNDPPLPPPPPPCNLDDSVSFAPAADSAAVRDLERAKENDLGNGLTGTQLTEHCVQQWQDVIETVHCPASAVSSFCSQACSSPEEARKCAVPPRSELVMRKCRRDSLATFTSRYPTCAGFTLCVDRLVAPGAPCEASGGE